MKARASMRCARWWRSGWGCPSFRHTMPLLKSVLTEASSCAPSRGNNSSANLASFGGSRRCAPQTTNIWPASPGVHSWTKHSPAAIDFLNQPDLNSNWSRPDLVPTSRSTKDGSSPQAIVGDRRMHILKIADIVTTNFELLERKAYARKMRPRTRLTGQAGPFHRSTGRGLPHRRWTEQTGLHRTIAA